MSALARRLAGAVLCSLCVAAPLRAADADAALAALLDAEWQRTLAQDPLGATYLGEPGYNDRWPDLSPAAFEAADRGDRAALDRLRAIDVASLSPARALDRRLFERELRERIEGRAFRAYLVPVDQSSGIQTASEVIEMMPFDTAAHYEDLLARMAALPLYMDQTIALMRQGLKEGRTAPRVIQRRAADQIRAQIVEDPVASPWYGPFATMPAAIPAARREALQARAREIVAGVIVPQYRRYLDFFESDYLPGSRETIACSALPDGAAQYAFLARLHTTTAMTPEAIHALGLAEVARIRGEMDKVIAATGFSGSFADFLHFLRTDPRFRYSDPQQLLLHYQAIAKRIDGELPRLFGVLPRTPYGVRPIPDTSAVTSTTAYYQGPANDGTRAGFYYVNLYKPETRPVYEMEALTAHESVPGHHLQIALAMELDGLPKFRRNGGYTAYVEGWGLYAESLGEQLGLYRDPYSKFGQLTYEMWRAVRLVVDTGMHAKGWSRERAIRYFMDNAAKDENDIVNEIDRYIAWPGQALAYKVGELKLQELRRRASERLGERFDIRAFHDVVLGSGALPLDVLEQNVDGWIAARAAAKG